MTRCTCAVEGCSNSTYTNDTLRFYVPPADPVTAQRWKKLIGRSHSTGTSNFYVCEEHFAPDCLPQGKHKKLTKKYAVPSLKLPPSSEDVAMVHKSTQYRAIDFPKPQEKKTKSTKNDKALFHELCDKFLEKDIATIVKAHTDIRRVLSERMHDSYNLFCLKFYSSSPSSYLALQSTLGLPEKRNLASLLLTSITDDHKKLLETLKAKVDCMSDLERNCSILVGFVNVKPHLFYHIKADKILGFAEKYGEQQPVPANHALVLIARGIYEPWVLAIDYALLPRESSGRQNISSWVLKYVKDLLTIGLNIRACISNLSPDTIAASSDPHNAPLSKIKPFFVVNNKIIYYMVDPTYIIKKIFSCFKEYEFHYLDTVATWKDIVDFYNIDSKMIHRLAPKLSEEHCSLKSDTPYHIMVETLSEPVAAGMSACVEFGAMRASALGTVQFLTIMNTLIDFTHSCNTPHFRQLKRPFEGSDSQINVIMGALTYLQNLKLIKNNVVEDRLDFIKDFQIAIKSLLMLSEDLKIEKLPNLFTKNINDNTVSNLFSSVSRRNKSGKILPWQLIVEFRQMFFRNILQTPKHRYCPEVLNGVFYEYLSSLNIIAPDAKSKTPTADLSVKVSTLSFTVRMADYKYIKLPKKDQLNAIGKFVLNKCLNIHTHCTLIRRSKKGDTVQDLGSIEERYPQLKYDSKTNTVTPDANFMHFIRALESELEVFLRGHFVISLLIKALGNRTDCLSQPLVFPCHCFPVNFMKELFFRLRLRLILKMNNKTYTNDAQELTFEYKSLP